MIRLLKTGSTEPSYQRVIFMGIVDYAWDLDAWLYVSSPSREVLETKYDALPKLSMEWKY